MAPQPSLKGSVVTDLVSAMTESGTSMPSMFPGTIPAEKLSLSRTTTVENENDSTGSVPSKPATASTIGNSVQPDSTSEMEVDASKPAIDCKESATTEDSTDNPVVTDSMTTTTTNNIKRKSTSSSKSDSDDMNWVCADCKEAECMLDPSAEHFLLCDGLCHRVFHYPCAGLSSIPDSDEDWICRDCTQGRHQCAFCHQYGKDNVDVFPCRRDSCGLFFHEACLALNNVEVKMESKCASVASGSGTATTANTTPPVSGPPSVIEADDDALLGDETLAANVADVAVTSVPIFTCPAHTCWTCTQKDALQQDLQSQAAEQQQKGSNKGGKRNKRGGRKTKQSIYQCKTEGRLFVSFKWIVVVVFCSFGNAFN